MAIVLTELLLNSLGFPAPIFSSSSHSHPHHDGPPPAAAALQQLCEDQSRFCDILRLFQTCDQPRTRAQCCFSCRRLEKEKAEPNTAMA